MLVDLPVSVLAKGAILVAAVVGPPIQIRNYFTRRMHAAAVTWSVRAPATTHTTPRPKYSAVMEYSSCNGLPNLLKRFGVPDGI